MSCCQQVLVRLVYYLSRILAVIEYRYDAKNRIFLKSRVGHCYLWIVQWICIWPLVLQWFFTGFILYSKDRDIDYNFIVFNSQMNCIISLIAGWKLLYNRENLLELLNSFPRLEQIHRQMFRKPLKVSSFYLLLHLIRGFVLWKLMSTNMTDAWFLFPLYFDNIRLMLQAYLADLAMMLHLQLLKPMARRLRRTHLSNTRKQKLNIEYNAQVINLRQNLQIFLWPFYLYRVIADSKVVRHSVFYVIFWQANAVGLFALLTEKLLFLSMIRIVAMARKVHLLEMQIINRLYDRELFGYVLKSNKERNNQVPTVSYAKHR